MDLSGRCVTATGSYDLTGLFHAHSLRQEIKYYFLEPSPANGPQGGDLRQSEHKSLS
jgi:hypothetical protein